MKIGGIGFDTARAVLLVGVAAAGLAACSPRENYRGYSFDNVKLSEIKPGKQTQDQVEAILGTPTTVSTFEKANNTWYYISKETESVAFFTPTVKSQRVVAIDFDNKGKVKDVRQYGLKDAKSVEPLDKITPTNGRKLGFFEQIFGNIGRFNSNKQPGQP